MLSFVRLPLKTCCGGLYKPLRPFSFLALLRFFIFSPFPPSVLSSASLTTEFAFIEYGQHIISADEPSLWVVLNHIALTGLSWYENRSYPFMPLSCLYETVCFDLIV